MVAPCGPRINCESKMWIVCQIGAREHYSIPRALHKQYKLERLITDAWVESNLSSHALLPSSLSKLQERYHSELRDASIHSFTWSLLRLELVENFKKNIGWGRVIKRNFWYQQHVLQNLAQVNYPASSPITLFAYSYAALDLFRFAKEQGWRTILGQIDPGIVEEQIVSDAHKQYQENRSNWQSAPTQYWENWKKECDLADRIVINSQWSKKALIQAGVSCEKLDIVPLAFEADEAGDNYIRKYPSRFSADRPLRALFLGQAIVRKGIMQVIEAAHTLLDSPIEFWVVGSQGIAIPTDSPANINWFGPVARSQTKRFYQQADLFLFPTLSDGFGLTQLEAQAWKLPLIVSKFCGQVAQNGVNGIVLDEVSGEAIAYALLNLAQHPNQLQMLADNSGVTREYSLDNLSSRLLEI